MVVDRERVKWVFAAYTDRYDSSDGKIKLKIDHTYRVADICERIAKSLSLSGKDIDLAWLLGMLHDIGRFEQLKRYGTFSDAQSIDHAHFGVELLYETFDEENDMRGEMQTAFAQGTMSDEMQAAFGRGIAREKDIEETFLKRGRTYFSLEGKSGNNIENTEKLPRAIFLEKFVEISPDEEEFQIIKTAIWNHSAYRVEEGLDDRTEMFCHILRDADKVDIFKVCHDIPLEVIYNVTTAEVKQAGVTDEVMKQFFERHAVLRSVKRTPVDNLVGHAALVFELVYPESLRLAREQGYLKKIFDFESDNPQTMEDFRRMRECAAEYVREKCGALNEKNDYE